MQTTLERVAHLLNRCGDDTRVLPPTALFNEGWMLRLVLDWAERHPRAISALQFDDGSRWYSEPLLGSRFKPRRRGDTAGEGFTHADGVIGHFRVRDNRGDIELLPNARQLTVIEAKMASGLSAGTKYAPEFNQAARNVACMAHLVSEANIDPATMQLRFVVLAPEKRIAEGVFAAAAIDAICETVARRAAAFDEAAQAWCDSCFKPVATRCTIETVSWEHILDEIEAVDSEAASGLRAFYAQALRHNPIRSSHRK
jgi:hypothetical protein